MPYKEPEKKKQHNREYYQKNKEKIKEYKKDNPYKKTEEYKERQKIWRKSEEGIKSYTKSNWKKRGVISDDYDKLYDYYLSIEECENCNILLNTSNKTKKCLDHDHETGLFRNVLCFNCNISRK
tara:strand:- start:119 stop:490 length:372 start_codon:yes stop_codon:yes gene_type:complete